MTIPAGTAHDPFAGTAADARPAVHFTPASIAALTIREVIRQVGGDPTAAAAAHQAEAGRGDAARSSLLEQLQRLRA